MFVGSFLQILPILLMIYIFHTASTRAMKKIHDKEKEQEKLDASIEYPRTGRNRWRPTSDASQSVLPINPFTPLEAAMLSESFLGAGPLDDDSFSIQSPVSISTSKSESFPPLTYLPAHIGGSRMSLFERLEHSFTPGRYPRSQFASTTTLFDGKSTIFDGKS